MVRICILNLIGLPAAGKTTFGHWLLNLPLKQFNVILLSYDDYLLAPEKGDFKIQRSQILELLMKIVQTIKNQQHFNISELKTSIDENINDYLIISDDNNYFTSMRYTLYQYCRNVKLSYAQIYFNCSLQMALERNEKRLEAVRIPDHVLKQMSYKLELPNIIKNSWENATLILNSNEEIFSSDYILPFIVNAFNNIPKAIIEQKSINFLSVEAKQHQLDLLLRHKIGVIMKNIDDKRNKALELNEKRKEILRKFKNIDVVDDSLDFDFYVELLS